MKELIFTFDSVMKITASVFNKLNDLKRGELNSQQNYYMYVHVHTYTLYVYVESEFLSEFY